MAIGRPEKAVPPERGTSESQPPSLTGADGLHWSRRMLSHFRITNEYSCADPADPPARYRYVPEPDSAVFEWDENTVEAFELNGGTVGAVETRPQTWLNWGNRRNRQEYAHDIETKKTLIKVRRVCAELTSEGRRDEASMLRDVALRHARPVTIVQEHYTRRFDCAVNIAIALAILFSLCAAPIVSWWTASDRGPWLFLLSLCEFIAFMTLLFVASLDEPHKRWPWLWRLVKFVGVVCVFCAFWVGFYFRGVNPGLLLEFAAGLTVCGLIFFACVLLITGPFFFVDYSGQGLPPNAVLLMDLVALVETARRWEKGLVAEAVLIHDIDQAAKRAERAFYRHLRGNNRHLRYWGSQRAHKVAAVLRKHEQKVVESTGAQKAVIRLSLVNGLACLVRGDWQSFLTVEPEPQLKSLGQRYAPRVMLSSLLVLLAFVLPKLFPSVVSDPGTFQATVLVTAGFSLLAPDVHKAAEAVKSSFKASHV